MTEPGRPWHLWLTGWRMALILVSAFNLGATLVCGGMLGFKLGTRWFGPIVTEQRWHVAPTEREAAEAEVTEV